MCRLDAISFDFIGRFESLSRDASLVVERLHQPLSSITEAFGKGREAHPTDAGKKLLHLFRDKVGDIRECGDELLRVTDP